MQSHPRSFPSSAMRYPFPVHQNNYHTMSSPVNTDYLASPFSTASTTSLPNEADPPDTDYYSTSVRTLQQPIYNDMSDQAVFPLSHNHPNLEDLRMKSLTLYTPPIVHSPTHQPYLDHIEPWSAPSEPSPIHSHFPSPHSHSDSYSIALANVYQNQTHFAAPAPRVKQEDLTILTSLDSYHHQEQQYYSPPQHTTNLYDAPISHNPHVAHPHSPGQHVYTDMPYYDQSYNQHEQRYIHPAELSPSEGSVSPQAQYPGLVAYGNGKQEPEQHHRGTDVDAQGGDDDAEGEDDLEAPANDDEYEYDDYEDDDNQDGEYVLRRGSRAISTCVMGEGRSLRLRSQATRSANTRYAPYPNTPQPHPSFQHYPDHTHTQSPTRPRRISSSTASSSGSSSFYPPPTPTSSSSSSASSPFSPASASTYPSSRRRRPRPQASIPVPVPVPNLTKKSRGRRVPTADARSGALLRGEGEYREGGRRGGAGGRSYTCVVDGCNKCFARGEHLKRHVRSIHTNEKPHRCEFPGCGKDFSRHDNLGQHMRVHKEQALAKGMDPDEYRG